MAMRKLLWLAALWPALVLAQTPGPGSIPYYATGINITVPWGTAGIDTSGTSPTVSTAPAVRIGVGQLMAFDASNNYTLKESSGAFVFTPGSGANPLGISFNGGSNQIDIQPTAAANLAIGGVGGAALYLGEAGATWFTGNFGPSAATHVMIPNTAPTVASGFGTSPSIPVNNGASVFTLNVGTGGSAVAGVVTMPAAATGWACDATNSTHVASFVEAVLPTSTTSITINNYSRTTGSAIAWTASDVLVVKCLGY